jgi:hypothetical protein
VLSELFRATMQQPDVWVCALNHFTIKLKHQAQYAVRRRMLWAKVQRVVFNFSHD